MLPEHTEHPVDIYLFRGFASSLDKMFALILIQLFSGHETKVSLNHFGLFVPLYYTKDWNADFGVHCFNHIPCMPFARYIVQYYSRDFDAFVEAHEP